MSAIHPPPDFDRCRAIVLYGGQRGRCRVPRDGGSDLCVEHKYREDAGELVRRVPVPARAPSLRGSAS